MVQDFNPREAARQLLQAAPPSRPLFLPIVFSLGARIENVSLRNYLTNPTKISNALRQIRAHVRSDGVTCYFDSYLEAEALGGVLDWESDSRRPALRWPQPSQDGELPEGLCSPDETPKRGRVPIAAEVIRRFKPLVRDDFLLVAGVTGPLTLAAQLSQLDLNAAPRPALPPDSTLNLAAEVVPVIAKTLVEAGANAVFIREEFLPSSPADFAEWAWRLTTTINIIRFYSALPILLLSPRRPAAGAIANAFREPLDAVVCSPLDSLAAGQAHAALSGVALPASAFDADSSHAEELAGTLRTFLSNLRPAVVSTSADLSPTADLKYLNAIAEEVNC
jgi:Uroporphyrinogen decarboxylase (URO-D)